MSAKFSLIGYKSCHDAMMLYTLLYYINQLDKVHKMSILLVISISNKFVAVRWITCMHGFMNDGTAQYNIHSSFSLTYINICRKIFEAVRWLL